jgi:hypothetical protein
MTDQRELDRLLDAYFVDGTNELTDRVIDAALDQIDHTDQRHAMRLPRRFQTMNMPTRIAAAAVIGVLAVGGAFYVTRPDRAAIGGPSPAPNATISPSASASPSAGPSASARPSAGPSAVVVPPRAAAWTATGRMITPRTGHMALLLLDGRVLVVGGCCNAGDSLNSAELYDPGRGTWASTGSMVGRIDTSATATLLADGKVLVAGGRSPTTGALASAELYDPIRGNWTATGSMAAPYFSHSATRLLDGKVLVVGILDVDGSTSAEVYDPVSATWTATGAPPVASGLTATLLPDGKVLLAGNDSPPGGPSAELYDPISGTWALTGNMITSRFGHTATLLPNGKVLVAGGKIPADGRVCRSESTPSPVCLGDPIASAELYDPRSGAWSATQGMVAPRASHTATLLPDGRVLLVGGEGDASTSAGFALASAELYDPASGTWSATASMAAARREHTATLLPDDRVLVASGTGDGIDGSVLAPSAELYDPGSGS